MAMAGDINIDAINAARYLTPSPSNAVSATIDPVHRMATFTIRVDTSELDALIECASPQAEQEITRLADYLMAYHAHAIIDGSAVDVAIRLLERLRSLNQESSAALRQEYAALDREIRATDSTITDLIKRHNALGNRIAELERGHSSGEAAS